MRRALLRVLVLTLASLAALTLVELGLRACEPGPVFRVWTPGLAVELEPRAELMHGVSGPARFRVSPLGFRAGERPADVQLSILALGGSATECLYLDQDEAWPARLEAELAGLLARRVWVANAGKSGRTTRDHVLQARQLLAQEPRFERVLLLTGVNDLCAWLAAGTVADSEADIARAFDVLPRALERGPWWRRTALFQHLRRLRNHWQATALAQDPSGRIYGTWRAHRQSARGWRDELPEPAAALAAFRTSLEEIERECARHGARLLIATQPALWRETLAPELEARLWMGGVGEYQRQPGCEYYTAAALARGLALFNSELARFARERGLALLDLSGALGGDPESFYDDVHFNEHGAGRVARFLGASLAALEER